MIIRGFTEKDRVDVEIIFYKYWNDPIFLKELSNALTDSPENFYIAEDNREIVGIVGYKNVPDYLKEFTKAENPLELYIIASKYKRKGIGKLLKKKIIEFAKSKKYSEILLFSPGTHSDSWRFHDTLNFKRVGEVTPPDDDKGYVWSCSLFNP